ncbi:MULTISPECIES: DUF5063 domain-containing protein [Isoptericola]|uniref:DUF5063 domain-containing protein n=1 Tax=Isoptericola sediminis TaxID=2733572 RepID=A0A849K4R1_9MICO|nr:MULTISPECIES: DUF5063 domain-containing protein [Isoptericola]MDO8145596.1 DUF5063 domain-containing protein [Isoptericola sp. 178]MDO8149208.1 DUF5063 domain-containing protein [Isoptericola sp. b515]MDO8152147.1 DUF5063 domain-containing protein [Isoptericola sp. b408]NNU26137.1 DUF5063 domain-containing protein [Isoptericola sediminis]
MSTVSEIAADSELREVADQMSTQARTFLSTASQVASGGFPGAELSLLILATSDLLAAGARLAAIVDVVPPQRFEPDAGRETDVDPLRTALGQMFDGFDDYVEVVDPVLGRELGPASLSGDLACVAEEIAKGLQHFDDGHELEGLWWWQFSYLSSWGERASSALRLLQSVLAHLRLDVEADVAAEAEYDALHS